MKKRRVIIFVLVYWCGLSSLSHGEVSSKPLLALSMWGGGVSYYTAFVLYDSGEVIFKEPHQPPRGYAYSHVMLTDSELEQFLNSLPSPEALYALNVQYGLPGEIVLDKLFQNIYLHLAETPKYISVYGSLRLPSVSDEVEAMYKALRATCPPFDEPGYQSRPIVGHLRKAAFEASQEPTPPRYTTVCGVQVAVSTIRLALRGEIHMFEPADRLRDHCPAELTNLFDALIAFRHQRATPWLPEKIEVRIDQTVDDGRARGIEWPAEWPGLDDPSTQKWGDEGQSYTLFLDSQNLEELKRYIGFGGYITLNGKLWSTSWRLPIPGERAWREGWRGRQ